MRKALLLFSALCILNAALLAQAPKKLLFLTHAGLYKHTSLDDAEKAVSELGKSGGFDVTTVEGYKLDAKEHDFSFLTPEYLAQFVRSEIEKWAGPIKAAGIAGQ